MFFKKKSKEIKVKTRDDIINDMVEIKKKVSTLKNALNMLLKSKGGSVWVEEIEISICDYYICEMDKVIIPNTIKNEVCRHIISLMENKINTLNAKYEEKKLKYRSLGL